MRMGLTAAAASLAALLPLSAFAEPVTLTIWHHTYPPAEDFIKQKAAEYSKTHPDVSFKFQSDPHGDYEVKLAAAIAAGEAPDLINVLDYLYPKFVAKGILAEADYKAMGVTSLDDMKALYSPGALDGLIENGKLYGLPEELNTFALFMNKAHFAEVGIDVTDKANWPKTWDDLFALAKKVEKKDASGNLERLGFNWVWGLDGFWYAMEYWPILNQYGCKVLDDSGKATINSPECVAAFTDTWKRVVTDGIGGPDYATVNPVNALQDFSDGRQSMMMAGIWSPPLFGDDVKKNYVVAPIPEKNPNDQHTLLYNYSMTVTAASKHQDEAWAFLRFLTSDGDGYLRHTGYVTGLKDWQTSPAAKDTIGADIFAEQLTHGTYFWRSLTWGEEGKAIKDAIEQFAQGGDVKEAPDAAAKQIDCVRGK